jgi:hypothetical protein
MEWLPPSIALVGHHPRGTGLRPPHPRRGTPNFHDRSAWAKTSWPIAHSGRTLLRVYEVKQAQIARAVDVLRAGPLTAAQFAARMWPDRERDPGRQAQAGHALLRRLGELGYLDRVADFWALRRFSTVSPDGTAVPSAVGTADRSADPSAVGLGEGLPDGLPVATRLGEPDEQAERARLHRLVRLAVDPVPTVTHDAVLGDLALRGEPVGDVITEACAIVVLLGRNANVYPPCGAPRAIVGLTPIESARVLHVRWLQSGRPPDLARPSAWITVEDGIVASPGYWRPTGAPQSWMEQEDIRVRLQRQRAAAGLA